MALPTSGCDSIHTLTNRFGRRCPASTSCLGIILVCRQELLLDLVIRSTGLFDKYHVAFFAALGEGLLGEGEKSGVSCIGDGAVAETSVLCNGTEHDEGAGNVVDALGVFEVHATADEEVDDAFLENAGRNIRLLVGLHSVFTIGILLLAGLGGVLVFLGVAILFIVVLLVITVLLGRPISLFGFLIRLDPHVIKSHLSICLCALRIRRLVLDLMLLACCSLFLSIAGLLDVIGL
ncbi:hypothetical protein HG530_011980 [Fusarium avenaceum]|nr:hypothetical protein HG530_011980 [Fusarium avenaceum]